MKGFSTIRLKWKTILTYLFNTSTVFVIFPRSSSVHETISSGCGVDMNQSGGGVDNGSDSSSSSGTVSGSESETESSGVDDRISLEGISVPQRQGIIEKPYVLNTRS